MSYDECRECQASRARVWAPAWMVYSAKAARAASIVLLQSLGRIVASRHIHLACC